MVKIIVDSTCDLSEEIIKEYGIEVVPLQVIVNTIPYRDKIEISVKDVHQCIANDESISTSLPLVEDFEAVFKPILDDGNDFIYLSFSANMSGSYQLSKMVVDTLKDEYPHQKFETVDTKSGALAIGLIAAELAQSAQTGKDFDSLMEELNILIENVRHVFMLNDLGQLAKGGRLTKATASIGNRMKIKPIMHVDNGEIHQLTQTRGTKSALKKVSDIVVSQTSELKKYVGINYSNNIQLAYDIKALLSEHNIETLFFEPIGSVLSTHIGLDAVGVFYFAK